MSGTVLKPHGCTSAYQDAVYGRGVRVFNIGKQNKAGATPETCTVCEPNALKKRLAAHARQHDPEKHGGRA